MILLVKGKIACPEANMERAKEKIKKAAGTAVEPGPAAAALLKHIRCFVKLTVHDLNCGSWD
jgi:hypothetical protein